MPRAEAGSTKAIANKIKSKGLTRLRFYCQVRTARSYSIIPC